MTLFVGTSGWQYKDWRGVLYPADVPVRLWLEQYTEHFPTVEINNAFYRLPTRETFEAWRERVPGDFVVAVKASRYLTHIKRLKDPQEPVHRLMSHAEGLGPRLGPVLLQLPRPCGPTRSCWTPAWPVSRPRPGSRWNPATHPGGHRRPERSWSPAARPCAGPTSAPAR